MGTQHLFNGGTVWVEGFEFVVTNLRIVESSFPPIMGPGVPVAQFVGVLTDNPCNDSIRGTMHDGATYGGNFRLYTW